MGFSASAGSDLLLHAGAGREPDVASSPFFGRTAVIATKHSKERVVGPIVAAGLGIDLVVPAGFDSDRFGTFTRDVPRAGSQREAARRKALAALELTGLDLAIASEGSFGPHPAAPFLTANIELVVLIDRAHDLEIAGSHVAENTVSGQRWVQSVEEGLEFAHAIGFPEHGLVVRRHPDDVELLRKDSLDEAQLCEAVARALAASDRKEALLEVDLRAHRNPTRMRAIAMATSDLVGNARRRCPACDAPGFSHVESETGLSCRWCRRPTEYVLSVVFGCASCSHRENLPRPDGKLFAEPGECGHCNP